MAYYGYIQDSLAFVLVAIVCRLLPFFFYACATREISLSIKGGLAISYAGLVAAGAAVDPSSIEMLTWILGALGYCFGGACVLFLAVPWLASGMLSRTALFMLCALLFIVLPALLVPSEWHIIVQAFGWKLMLSGYSYAIESSTRGRGSLRDGLFFLLVNPTLVFVAPENGLRVASPGLTLRGFGRVLGGISSLLFYGTAFGWVMRALGESGGGSPLVQYAVLIAFYGSICVGEYMLQSGNVSVQIGLMRLIGYEVPECFDRPLLARSPADFWQRWNRYLGSWCQRYLFTPTALAVVRKWRGASDLAVAAAVLVTFASMGVLHDLAVYAREPTSVPTRLTMFFVGHGIVLLAWEAVARRVRLSWSGWRPISRPTQLAVSVGGWLVFGQIMVGAAWAILSL